ncbi:MAG: c-type cytochrome [Chitinophagaceae bacterium]|jgi:thiosulfate dehydrogenase|nr:c-type cytochrome [Chitinophagaceae bacterium]
MTTLAFMKNSLGFLHRVFRQGRSQWSLALVGFVLAAASCGGGEGGDGGAKTAAVSDSIYVEESPWRGWNKYQIKLEDTLARYGRELIEHTSRYLGPKGTVAAISNGMNCQNCHLDGGTIPWGNNYSAVVSTYPKFRDRSGSVETIPKRVNDCFERSLNGKALDTASREMKAILAYMHWLGDDIPKGKKPKGSGIMELPFMDRAADPAAGKAVYMAKCQVCHGPDGQGQKSADGYEYTYPPLWGEHSYNSGAGLFRITRFAGYVKASMPFGLADHKNPQLSDAEAWDVAAFVNSQPRPKKDLSGDWPDISKKPLDHPFGPYADGFTENQHKYGPFGPIEKARKEKSRK